MTVDFAAQPNAITQGTYAYAYDADAIGAVVGVNNSGIQDDELRWWLPLNAGTWRFDFAGREDADGAIITWEVSFNGGGTWTALGTTDEYAASPAGVTDAFTGITVPAMSQLTVLRARARTRNESNTTGWAMRFSSGVLVRTA